MNNYNSSIMSPGGRFYWARNSNNNNNEASKGIVVVFGWVSVSESQLNVLVSLYSSFGWNSLVSRADYLNPFIPERATSLAFTVLNELIKELRRRPCPVVFASFSGGSKACMYKVFQIIGGCAELDFGLEDSRLVASCISGQIYDSDPIEFTSDLGARFALHRSILKMPGSSKLVSLFAKGITSGLDALFLTRFGSQREEYWQTLYSSVGLETPFLVLCSEKDDVELLSTLYNFVQHLQDAGANVKLVKSPLIGNSKLRSTQYKAAVTEILEQAVSNFPQKIQMLGEKSQMDDFVSDLICDLQNAAVDSCQSFKRVAAGPNDHFFLPSLAESRSSREIGSLQEERKERSPVRSIPSMSANTVLGQILFDVCVPKNVEGWDVKFSGSLNGEPFASVRRRSPYRAIKLRSRL